MPNASTISTNRGRKKALMPNNKLWNRVVDDYYKDANSYLVVEA